MTKLKTKKGKPIAKRTLSVILAAAMVLSSNSLVWANADVEPQAEVEVVSEEAVSGQDVQVAADGDYNTEGYEAKVELQDAAWDQQVVFKDGWFFKKNGKSTKFNYTWQVFDGNNWIATSQGTQLSGDGVSVASYTPSKEECGKQVRIVLTSTDANSSFTYESAPITVGQKVITGISLDVSGIPNVSPNKQTAYTGKELSLDEVTLTGVGSEVKSEDFIISQTPVKGNLVDVGSEIAISAELKPEVDAYYDVEIVPFVYTIVAAEVKIEDLLDITINDVTYPYTGNPGYTFDNGDVVVKGDNEDDFTSAVKSVKWLSGQALAAGKYDAANGFGIEVTVDADQLPNYRLDKTTAWVDKGTVTISKRDLSTVTVEKEPRQYVQKPDGSNYTVADYLADGMITYSVDGEELNLANDVELVGDTVVTAPGKYTFTVKAKSGNVENSTTGTLIVSKNSFANANFVGKEALTNEPYTGSAIEKTAAQLGDLKIGDQTINTNDYEITYKNNTDAGKAQLIVTGTDRADNNYAGARKVFEFTIDQAVVDKDATEKATAKTVVYDASAKKAEDYADAMAIVVKAKNTAKVPAEFTLTEDDYKVTYKFLGENKVNNKVEATITLLNDNFKFANGTELKLTAAIVHEAPVVTLEGETFAYTGADITPEVKVTIGGKEVAKSNYKVTYTNNDVVGTATALITFTSAEYKYLGTLEKEFEITKADIEDVTVKVNDVTFKGTKYEADELTYTITLGDKKVNVAKDFEVSVPEADDVNVNAGEGTIILTAKNNNFEGSKEFTFKIEPAVLEGTLEVRNELGVVITSIPKREWDGEAQELDRVSFKVKDMDGDLEKYVTEDDYEIAYADNKDAGTAKIFVLGKGNFKGAATVTTTAGDKIESVVTGTQKTFDIVGDEFTRANITVAKTAEYGEGVPVKPEVSVVKNGITLVEGVDFQVNVVKGGIELGKGSTVEIVGLGKYAETAVSQYSYEIVAKDLKNCEVIATADNVTVMNGNVVVDSSEYTVKDNGDGTVTVTAKEDSKKYTGSATAAIVESDNQVLDVVAKPYTKTKIHVTWRNVKGADSYVIYKDGVKIADAEDGKEGYIDGGMHSYDGIYEYQVAAVFNGKEGTKSDVYESTTRPADPVVNKAFTHKNGIRVETKAKGAEGYRVWIRQGGSNPTEYVEKKSTYGNYTFKDLKNGQKYVIKVQAYKLVNGKKVPSRNVVYVTGKAETAKKSLI